MSALTFELYGRLEKLANQSEINLDINTPVSLESALEQLATLKPDLTENLERCACAIGDELVSRSTLVESGSRIALLPPVAGG